jgi:hypothetical protein
MTASVTNTFLNSTLLPPVNLSSAFNVTQDVMVQLPHHLLVLLPRRPRPNFYQFRASCMGRNTCLYVLAVEVLVFILVPSTYSLYVGHVRFLLS